MYFVTKVSVFSLFCLPYGSCSAHRVEAVVLLDIHPKLLIFDDYCGGWGCFMILRVHVALNLFPSFGWSVLRVSYSITGLKRLIGAVESTGRHHGATFLFGNID